MATATKKKPAPITTGTAWDRAVLAGIGAKATKSNLMFLDLWRRIEGGPANNPLNTSLNTANVTGTVNSSGVKTYNSVQAGIQATVATLKLPYYKEVVSLLQKGTASPPELATAVSSSPWDKGHYGAKKTPSGTYIGGNLVNLAIGGPTKYTSPSLLGEIAHYTAHPGAGVQTTAAAAGSALSSPMKYILYGGAILGGVLLGLVAFILIGADLGLSALNKTPVAKGGMAIARVPKARRETKARATISREKVARGAQSHEARERRSEEKHQANLKLSAARTTELRSRSRARTTKARLTKEERAKEYKRGALDQATAQASPTLTQIRRKKSA